MEGGGRYEKSSNFQHFSMWKKKRKIVESFGKGFFQFSKQLVPKVRNNIIQQDVIRVGNQNYYQIFFSVERETVCKFLNCFFFFLCFFLIWNFRICSFLFFFCYQLFHLDFPSLEHTCRTYLGYNLLQHSFIRTLLISFVISIFSVSVKNGGQFIT